MRHILTIVVICAVVLPVVGLLLAALPAGR